MSRLTKQEIELTCREIVAAADYMSVTKADLQQVCDLALQSLSQEAVRDEALENVALVRRLLRHEALLSLMIENSVAVEGGIVAIKRELYEELRDLNNAPSILRALKREPNAAEDSGDWPNFSSEAERYAPAAPDVAEMVDRLLQPHALTDAHPSLREFHREAAALILRLGQSWIPVSERLPEGKRGVPYMTFMTDAVLVLHSDRPDYPLTAHAALGNSLDARGMCIPTNGASEYKEIAWYSVGRDLCNPFDMASGPKGPFKDSAGYTRFLPCYFGLGITHWMPIPPPPGRP